MGCGPIAAKEPSFQGSGNRNTAGAGDGGPVIVVLEPKASASMILLNCSKPAAIRPKQRRKT